MVAGRRRSLRGKKAEEPAAEEPEVAATKPQRKRKSVGGAAEAPASKKKKKQKAAKAAEPQEEQQVAEPQPDDARKEAVAKAALNLETTNKLQDKTRGMPKSGRAWKQEKTVRSSTHKVKTKASRLNYERRMERKRERDEMRAREAEMKEREREERRLLAERRRTKQKIREENQKKSSVVQEIKDINKIKRMGKKQLRYIMTMDTVKQAAKHRKMYA